MRPGDLVKIRAKTGAWMDNDPIASEIGMVIDHARKLDNPGFVYWQIMFLSETRPIAEQALEVIYEEG